jgi:ADP-ribosyl-[dinitrogen reductase] hydrolase
MAWFHLPIADVSAPDGSFETAWTEAGRQLRSRLRNGFDIVVHCKGGLGRAGTVAARLLSELGMEPADAIQAVREARPGAIETDEQEDHILRQRRVAVTAPSEAKGAIRERAAGALLGLAVGDAIGTTLEFRSRDTYPPLSDMVGGGPFQLKPGEWTDDTAMALALAESLARCGGLDEFDVMRRFCAWRDEGRYSCTGTCFDIGVTTSAALDRWQRSGNPVAGSADPGTAGNGSLMRLAPVAIRYWDDLETLRDVAARQSRTTHAAPEAVDACIAYAEILAHAIAGRPFDTLHVSEAPGLAPRIDEIVSGAWRGKSRNEIQSSGYVAHSLEAALWSVARSGSFEEAVLTAANLGDDADTTAAIAGQLAGALYGVSGIPDKWRAQVAWGEQIAGIADSLMVS